MRPMPIYTIILGILTVLAVAASGREPDPPMRWWKGNLHTHTFWSDGNHFPEMIVDWYERNGYHFLAISDHNTLNRGDRWIGLDEVRRRSRGHALAKYHERFGSSWVEIRDAPDGQGREVRLKPMNEYRALFEQRGEFLLLHAEEVTTGSRDGRSVHLNATNVSEMIDPPEGETVSETIAMTLERARDQEERTGRSILVHVNHPNYKWGVTAEDLAKIADERFFEVWNGVDGDNDPGDATHPSTGEIWDIANTLRIAGMNQPPLFGLATDDAHTYHWQSPRLFPGRAWVQVRARRLTPESLIRAFERGAFYASTGVTLESIEHDESGTLSLRIEPVEGERYTTRFIGTRLGANLEGKHRRDASGEIVQTTLDYTRDGSAPIGEVLAEVDGLSPSYTLRGDELYVRAVVVSSAAPDIPSRESTNKRAWTQPIGWRRHVPETASRKDASFGHTHPHSPQED